MKQYFESATLKLTAWYLAILLCISLIFSVIIYEVSMNEIRTRLGVFETHLQEINNLFVPPEGARAQEVQQARINLFVALAYANISVLILGGIASYFSARRTLEPIEALHDAQSRFASDASHELRTPLAVMKSELEVSLRDKNISKSDMRELLESNLEEVNRLTALSETLLRLSRHEFSRLEMKPVDIAEILKKAGKVHKLPKARLMIDIRSKHLMAVANADSVSELFMILLDNALRYSPDASQVVALAERTRGTVQVKIINDGPGIQAQDLPHIFERFYRADKSRTSGDMKGFGLGLSLAKKIADLHHAKLSISSQPEQSTIATVQFE